MRIETTQPSSLGLLGRGAGMIPEWRVGAVVQATAVRDSAGQLWLSIGQNQLAARLASGHAAGPANGENLRLRVLRNSPVLAFETLDADSSPAADHGSDALRRLLPRQTSQTPLLANLAWLARTLDAGGSLPPAVLAKAAQLWNALPTAALLADPDGLATALARSGLFLESRLAGQSSRGLLAELPLKDLKALLLSLKDALAASGARASGPEMRASEIPAPLPGLGGSLLPLAGTSASLAELGSRAAMVDALNQETEGTLSRLVATQLINASASGTAWLVEIPFRQQEEPGLVRFRFEHGGEQDGQEAGGWAVEMALEVGNGAGVHARMTLREGRISVLLRSDSPAIVGALRSGMRELELALARAGLDVDQIVCLHGMPVADPGERRARLVDVRA